MKMWSGRFREPLDPTFDGWQRSFRFDWRLIPYEVAASKAHARALAELRVLTEDELLSIHSGLDSILAEFYSASSANHGNSGSVSQLDAEDVHHFVELELKTRIGNTALKLHTGRSRNEQIATDLRLYIRDAVATLQAGLHSWMKAFLTQAKSAGDAAMPAYTHMQRAEPVLVAHWLLAYVSMLQRDRTRLEDCARRLNICPLGSGAVAGATLPLDRVLIARELGFDAPTTNSMDATSDRDFVLEYLQSLAQIALHVSRFAEEITLYATAEFGFVDLPEAFSTGSSAMPQKKNPDLTELARAKAGRIIAASHTVELQLKGLPLAYNKDMQEMQEALFPATEEMHALLSLLGRFTEALHFRTEKMLAASTAGFLNAMAAATYLVHKGVAFRTAHEIIGNAVRHCLGKGCELDGLTLEELRQFSPAFEQDFFAAITLEATLDCHDVIGGTARSRVQDALTFAELRASQGTESESASSTSNDHVEDTDAVVEIASRGAKHVGS
ncbi:MAG: argininosuccinate lyase [Terriglobia bacterium]|nr:argininosuccinate lyase [Terriglobia bacterium]